MKSIRVLMITTEYPSEENAISGIFVAREVNLLRLAGIDLEVFVFRGKKRLVNYIRAWVQVHALLKHEHFDLIHAQFGQSGLPALFPKLKPLVISFRGSDVEGIVNKKGKYTFLGRVLQKISRYTASRADECIVVSDRLTNKLPPRKYHIIPSGIDLDLFKPAPQVKMKEILGLTEEKRYILFGGNPAAPVKRYGLALKVLNLVQEHFHNVELLTLRDVPHEEMPVFINACDLLLLTSRHEGCPNIVKEALACNLPIVSTDVGDVKDRIGEIEGCIVCESDDAEVISEAVIQVLRRGKRIQGRDQVCDLDEKFVARKIIDVYTLAIAQKH